MDKSDPTDSDSAPRRRSNRQRKPKEHFDPSLPPAKIPKLSSSSDTTEQDDNEYRTGGVRTKVNAKSREEKSQDSSSQCTSTSYTNNLITKTARVNLCDVLGGIRNARSTREFKLTNINEEQLKSLKRIGNLNPNRKLKCLCEHELPELKGGLQKRMCMAQTLFKGSIVTCGTILIPNNKIEARASEHLRQKLLCFGHLKRMKLHECCPTCGKFCLEDEPVTLSCADNHKFHAHEGIVLTECPHCGKPYNPPSPKPNQLNLKSAALVPAIASPEIIHVIPNPEVEDIEEGIVSSTSNSCELISMSEGEEETGKDNSSEDEEETRKDNSSEDGEETRKDNSSEDEEETRKDNSSEDEEETGKDNSSEDEEETGKDNSSEFDIATSPEVEIQIEEESNGSSLDSGAYLNSSLNIPTPEQITEWAQSVKIEPNIVEKEVKVNVEQNISPPQSVINVDVEPHSIPCVPPVIIKEEMDVDEELNIMSVITESINNSIPLPESEKLVEELIQIEPKDLKIEKEIVTTQSQSHLELNQPRETYESSTIITQSPMPIEIPKSILNEETKYPANAENQIVELHDAAVAEPPIHGMLPENMQNAQVSGECNWIQPVGMDQYPPTSANFVPVDMGPPIQQREQEQVSAESGSSYYASLIHIRDRVQEKHYSSSAQLFSDPSLDSGAYLNSSINIPTPEQVTECAQSVTIESNIIEKEVKQVNVEKNISPPQSVINVDVEPHSISCVPPVIIKEGIDADEELNKMSTITESVNNSIPLPESEKLAEELIEIEPKDDNLKIEKEIVTTQPQAHQELKQPRETYKSSTIMTQSQMPIEISQSIPNEEPKCLPDAENQNVDFHAATVNIIEKEVNVEKNISPSLPVINVDVEPHSIPCVPPVKIKEGIDADEELNVRSAITESVNNSIPLPESEKLVEELIQIESKDDNLKIEKETQPQAHLELNQPRETYERSIVMTQSPMPNEIPKSIPNEEPKYPTDPEDQSVDLQAGAVAEPPIHGMFLENMQNSQVSGECNWIQPVGMGQYPPTSANFVPVDMGPPIQQRDQEQVSAEPGFSYYASLIHIRDRVQEKHYSSSVQLFSDARDLYCLGCTKNITDFPEAILKAYDEKNWPLLYAVLLDADNDAYNMKFSARNGKTLLHIAVEDKNMFLVVILLTFYEDDDDRDKLDNNGMTALLRAIELDQPEIATYLVSMGCNPYKEDADGDTPLHFALKSRRLNCLKALVPLRQDFINKPHTKTGLLPIMIALEHNFVEESYYLILDCHSDLRKIDPAGNTSLHWCAFGDALKLVDIIIEHGGHWLLAAENHLRETPLDVAANQCNDRMTCLLGSKNYKFGRLEVVSYDVSNGQEKSPISCVNEYDTERLNESSFFYIKEIDPEIKTALTNWSQTQVRNIGLPCWCVVPELASRTPDRFTYSPLGLLCTSSSEGPPMIYECSSKCRCNPKKCPNRIVQNGITLPLQVFRKNPAERDGKLWGLQALSEIPKGTFICEFVGELILVSSMEAMSRMKLDVEQYYGLIRSGPQDKLYGISTRCSSNVSHYINHSIESNVGTVHVTDETSYFVHAPKIAIFATQDIKPEEEITLNYLSPYILPS